MILREMLNEVLSQSGFITRTQFVGSTDPDDKQMVSIANRVLKEIRDYYPWEQLRKEYALTMIDGITLYSLPDDFQEYIPNSGWQDMGSRQIELPVPDGRWYMYKNSGFSSGGTYRCRLNGRKMEIADPEPGQTILFYYRTSSAAVSNTDTFKIALDDDEDRVIFPDQLFILGVQAHWAETKLLPQADKWMVNYYRKMNAAIGRDKGGRTIGGMPTRTNGSCRSPYYPLWRT